MKNDIQQNRLSEALSLLGYDVHKQGSTLCHELILSVMLFAAKISDHELLLLCERELASLRELEMSK